MEVRRRPGAAGLGRGELENTGYSSCLLWAHRRHTRVALPNVLVLQTGLRKDVIDSGGVCMGGRNWS